MAAKKTVDARIVQNVDHQAFLVDLASLLAEFPKAQVHYSTSVTVHGSSPNFEVEQIYSALLICGST